MTDNFFWLVLATILAAFGLSVWVWLIMLGPLVQ